MVIDECHHVLTPSYTGLLRWLGQHEDDEPPVIGLSATPFRGRNDDETEQLARRFDGRLLPRDQSRLFDLLQKQGVLATFGYTRLEMERRFAPPRQLKRATKRRAKQWTLNRLFSAGSLVHCSRRDQMVKIHCFGSEQHHHQPSAC